MITSFGAIIQPRQGRHMGEGRAVEGRQANPSVCFTTPLLTGSPKAFSAQDSVRAIALLPGSAQNVECDVTYSKQTTGTFLTGARIALKQLRFRHSTGVSSRPIHSMPSISAGHSMLCPYGRELTVRGCLKRSKISGSAAVVGLACFGLQVDPVPRNGR